MPVDDLVFSIDVRRMGNDRKRYIMNWTRLGGSEWVMFGFGSMMSITWGSCRLPIGVEEIHI